MCAYRPNLVTVSDCLVYVELCTFIVLSKREALFLLTREAA